MIGRISREPLNLNKQCVLLPSDALFLKRKGLLFIIIIISAVRIKIEGQCHEIFDPLYVSLIRKSLPTPHMNKLKTVSRFIFYVCYTFHGGTDQSWTWVQNTGTSQEKPACINNKVDWCEFGTFLPSENIFSEASNDSRHDIKILVMLANKL